MLPKLDQKIVRLKIYLQQYRNEQFSSAMLMNLCKSNLNFVLTPSTFSIFS